MIDFTVQSQVISFSAVAVFALAYFALDLIIVVRIRHRGATFGWALFFILSWIVLLASLAFSLMTLIYKFGIFGLTAEIDGADVIITSGGRRLVPIPFIAPFAQTLFDYPAASALTYSLFVLSLLAVVLLPVKWKRRDDYLSPVLPGEGEGYFSVSENAAREVNSAFGDVSDDEAEFADFSSGFAGRAFDDGADAFDADVPKEADFLSAAGQEMPAPIPEEPKSDIRDSVKSAFEDASDESADKPCDGEDIGLIGPACAPEAETPEETASENSSNSNNDSADEGTDAAAENIDIETEAETPEETASENSSNSNNDSADKGATAAVENIKRETEKPGRETPEAEPEKNIRGRRAVVTSRAMEIFSEYLEGKDEQEKMKLEASIDKITLDRKND